VQLAVNLIESNKMNSNKSTNTLMEWTD